MMPEGPFGVPRFTHLATLTYSVVIKPPIEKSEKEIENIVAGAVDENILPDIATKDVQSGRVQEPNVPMGEQDLGVTVETDNISTSNHTLNKIEKDINESISGKVLQVSVQAKPSNAVKELVDKIRGE